MVSEVQVELGGVGEDGFRSFAEAFDRTFGMSTTDEAVERFRGFVELDRLLAARTPTGEVVATSGAYSFDLALPFARPAGCAGITVVSVRGDHRRRGILTRMMASLLDQAHDRDEPFAALWASEAPIYGRYGFGPAAPTISVELQRAHSTLRVDGPVGDVRSVGLEQAMEAFPPIYESARARRPGLLSRSAAWWQRVLGDPSDRREGAGPLHYSLLPGRGFVVHRLRSRWDDGAPSGIVEVFEQVALDPGAAAALWRFVIDTDLAVRVQAGRRPVDDAILAMLVDPARAKVTSDWPLYLRLVDLPTALEARGYAGDGDVVLEVHDRFRPTNSGTWRLVARDGRASCERTDAAHDLALDAEALATVFLGGVRSTALGSAGRITERSAGSLARLDRMLSTDVAPWHGGMF
jgi:predicted acetyltransferase